MASFDGTNGTSGSNPRDLVRDADGNLYGTTIRGGVNNAGTIFEVAAGSGTINTLASFTKSNGDPLYGGLVRDGFGNLYGTSFSDGPNGLGSVFKLAAGSGTITTLVSFTDLNQGSGPNGTLVLDEAGNLFGTTFRGGLGGYGTVFEIAAGTSSIATLFTFDRSNGARASGGLILDSAGNLYGTTQSGGANGAGTVFELSRSSAVPEPASVMILGQGALAAVTLTGRVRARRRRAA